jgi:ribose transport system permease protein
MQDDTLITYGAPKVQLTRRDRIRKVLSRPRVMFWIAPTIFVIVFSFAVYQHRNADFWFRITSVFEMTVKECTPLALMAIGAGLVLSTGGVDLSSSGTATLAGIIFASAMQLSYSPSIAILLGLGMGALSGLLLSIMVNRSAPALIASWAIGSLWLILGLIIAKRGPLGITSSTSGVSFSVAGTWLDVGLSRGSGIYLCLILLTVVATILVLSNIAPRACAVGANRDSAIYAGIRTRSLVRACYITSGCLSSAAGMMWALLVQSGTTLDLVGRELSAIAVAVLGGTVMTGGYLFIPSIIAAAGVWTLLFNWSQTQDLSTFETYQQHAANSLFAIFILLISYVAGGRLSGVTQTIIRDRVAEEKR